jgi:hypothetical protein
MKNPKQHIAKATCILCDEEPSTSIILSTGRIVKAFGLCLACREHSINDIIEELSSQDLMSGGGTNGT